MYAMRDPSGDHWSATMDPVARSRGLSLRRPLLPSMSFASWNVLGLTGVTYARFATPVPRSAPQPAFGWTMLACPPVIGTVQRFQTVLLPCPLGRWYRTC